MDETRRYRGLVRTSLTAGAVMSAIAAGTLAIGVVAGVVPSGIFGIRELLAVAFRGFCAGAVAGGLFAWFAARGARGQQLSTLSTRRVALWGGLATAGLPLMAALAVPTALPLGILAGACAVFGLGGSAVSAGMLKLARRAPRPYDALNERTEHLLP